MRLIEGGKCVSLYLPESFEWIILRSGLLKDSEVDKILDGPEKYVESSLYFKLGTVFHEPFGTEK